MVPPLGNAGSIFTCVLSKYTFHPLTNLMQITDMHVIV